jgi:membrane fusion protein, multidrug efflux system
MTKSLDSGDRRNSLQAFRLTGSNGATFCYALGENKDMPGQGFATGHKRYWIGLIGIAFLGVGIYIYFVKPGEADSPAARQRQNPGARPVSVVVAKARAGDMPVYLSGLGTVTPLNTVTVKSRVDGQLMKASFKEGDVVRSGDLLAEIDPRPFQVQLTQAEGQMAKDQALLKNAQLDLERYQTLYKQDSIAQQQLDTQQALVRQFEGAVKVDQGQIDNARLQLTYCRITAPITGRVGLRLVDPGNIVHAADTNGLLVITQLQPITVVFTIPEDSLPQVQQQLRAGRRLEVDAYDRDMKRKLASGSLLTIDNQIDPTTGTVKLKAIFQNADDALFPNQFVNARLLVDTMRNAVLVPNAAIQHSPQSAFVYIVKPDNTAEARSVEVQGTERDQTAIARGLTAEEVVVTDGVDKLQPGAKVALQGSQSSGS